MKNAFLRTALILGGTIGFFFSQAQLKDSATYKQSVVQLYKRYQTGFPTYKYMPNGYTQYEQDTMFTNALAWKKQNLDYPMILNYYNLRKGSKEANSKIKYFSDTASSKEYNAVLSKAVKLFQAQHKQTPKKYVSPGIKTLPKKKGGEIINTDKQIKDEILKNWKF